MIPAARLRALQDYAAGKHVTDSDLRYLVDYEYLTRDEYDSLTLTPRGRAALRYKCHE